MMARSVKMSNTYLYQSGYTLVELLTVILIISIAASLAIPAILDSRSMMHKLQCSNNLRQIGVGLQRFESVHNKFPGMFAGASGKSVSQSKPAVSYSPSSWIASDLDGNALSQKVEYEQISGEFDPNWSRLNLDSPAVLRCTADILASEKASSYRYCRGVFPIWPGNPGGVFTDYRNTTTAQISDGLSQTAFASERLINKENYNQKRIQRDLLKVKMENSLTESCFNANKSHNIVHSERDKWFNRDVGVPWNSGSFLHAAYYHILAPNSPWADCIDDEAFQMSLVTARSHHKNGVNLLYGDGHVVFIGNNVSLPVWRSISTKSGNDNTGDSQ